MKGKKCEVVAWQAVWATQAGASHTGSRSTTGR